MNYRDEYRTAQREAYWTLPKLAMFIVIAGIVLITAATVLGWFGETAQVAQQQFGPNALLVKYEWFKDASAQLDKKQADIAVYDQRLKGLRELYQGVRRPQWARDDREQYSIWESEAAGIRASYNQLAADYNAEMAKFNYKFANVGELPQGATKPLPREYKPYITE